VALSGFASDYEIIMVNDGSPDEDWAVIKVLAAGDRHIKGVSLSRNFGQHNAIRAGMQYASCDWVVVMDADLQDAPEETPVLYAKAMEGYDVVFARRNDRQDSLSKKLSSVVFHRFLAFLSGMPCDCAIGNFSIVSRKVRTAFLRLKEQSLCYPFTLRWLGFKIAEADVRHCARKNGKTSYSIRKSIGLAASIALSHSNKPLWISIAVGGAFSTFSGIYGCLLIIRHFFDRCPVQGWTSLMVSLYFLCGLLLVQLGVVGLYVGRIFEEAKARPAYIADETLNLPD